MENDCKVGEQYSSSSLLHWSPNFLGAFRSLCCYCCFLSTPILFYLLFTIHKPYIVLSSTTPHLLVASHCQQSCSNFLAFKDFIQTENTPFMALLVTTLLFALLQWSNAQPSPGYYPSYRFRPLRHFHRGFSNLWGPQHQYVSGDQSLTIWLDKTSGSGFKSNRPFRNGYFGASIKLQPGYTAGVITAFYLSNNQAHPGFHDEVDIEFLGTTPGKPYILQTNVYVRGSGDATIIGREMKFNLWFDPTASFHNYAILWNPSEIIFFVDDIPVRRYPRKNAATFPLRPMWLYGSIWDASSWATEDGKYKADYHYQPFVARFTRFTARGCSAYAPSRCRPVPSSPFGAGLSSPQYAAMRWAQRYHMVYNYCKDPRRVQSLTPECWDLN